MGILNLLRVGTSGSVFAGEPWAVALAVGLTLAMALLIFRGASRESGADG